MWSTTACLTERWRQSRWVTYIARADLQNHLQLLAASITALTNTLRSNPLIPELQRAYAVLEETLTTERRTHKRLRDTEMPAAIRTAVHYERMRMGDLLKEERKEKERFKMELDREKASRRAATASWEDRVGSSRREVENAQRWVSQFWRVMLTTAVLCSRRLKTCKSWNADSANARPN